MLVLMRRVGESLYIGDDIVVTLVEMEAGRVWIGVETQLGIRTDRDPMYVRRRDDAGRPDMLIIMRYTAECIYIGDDIVVAVSAIERNRVRIGVEADVSIRIDRAEVYERRKEEARADQGGPQEPVPEVKAIPVRYRKREERAREEAPEEERPRPVLEQAAD